MNNILYKVHDNLYVNLTNRCPCRCTFCLRQTMDRVGESDSLWLKEEPDFPAIQKEFESRNSTKYASISHSLAIHISFIYTNIIRMSVTFKE